MAKKDFSTIDTSSVYGTIAEATAPAADQEQNRPKSRREYTAEERLQFMEEMRTSGRKGIKMDRINMAFTPDIFEYIQIMSRVTGMTKTGFVNHALKQHMEEHGDLYEKAKEFRRSL